MASNVREILLMSLRLTRAAIRTRHDQTSFWSKEVIQEPNAKQNLHEISGNFQTSNIRTQDPAIGVALSGEVLIDSGNPIDTGSGGLNP